MDGKTLDLLLADRVAEEQTARGALARVRDDLEIVRKRRGACLAARPRVRQTAKAEDLAFEDAHIRAVLASCDAQNSVLTDELRTREESVTQAYRARKAVECLIDRRDRAVRRAQEITEARDDDEANILRCTRYVQEGRAMPP